MGVTGDSNVQIFMDTLDKSNNLKQTDWHVAKYYDVEALERISRNHQDQTGDIQISVSKEDSFQAARRLKNQNKDKDVLVLNFANSVSQGGGVRIGALAQEEDLCRTSTLYQSLISEEAYLFYSYNRKNNLGAIGSDTAVYSPNVYIIKDENYQDIDPVKVSVLTMASPVREAVTNATEILNRRIYKLLCLAENLGYNTLILGAWGCGAFGNDPEDVADIFKKNLRKFNYFEHVMFAVKVVTKRDKKNYQIFKEILA